MARIHITRTRLAIAEQPCVDNILTTLAWASEHEHVQGMAWYDMAHEFAVQIGPDAVTAAGVIAALSPQIGWVDNLAAAECLVNGLDVRVFGVLGPNIVKAERIAAGESPSDVLGGRKVRAFYRNILLPDRPGPVTVDRHALNLAMAGPGRRTELDKVLQRRGGYEIVAGAYRAAAREYGVLPQQMQAITWLVQRRLLDEQATGNLAVAHRQQRRNA